MPDIDSGHNPAAREGLKFTVTLKIGLATFLGAVAATLIFTFVASEWRPVVVFAAAAASAAAAVHAGYYAALANRREAAQLRLNRLGQMTDRSMDFLNRLSQMDMSSALVDLTAIAKEEKTDNDRYEQIVSNTELRTKVVHLFGFIEDVAVAIQSGRVDEVTLYKSMNYIVKSAWEKYHGYVTTARIRNNDNSLYCEWQALEMAWRQEKSLLTGHKLAL